MIKKSDSVYETCGKRTNKWLKLKHPSLVSDKMRDSLDLIPIGAFYGKGNRGGVFGSYLMAGYDQSKGVFQATCKMGTGLK